MALQCSALLLLAHAVQPYPLNYHPLSNPAPAFDAASYLKELIYVGIHALQDYVDEQVPQKLFGTLSVSPEDSAYEFIRLAQELKPDLIVIATPGGGG